MKNPAVGPADYRKVAPGESPACSLGTEGITGVDVAKATSEVFELETEQGYSVPNERGAIEPWLGRWCVPNRLAI